MKGSVNIVGYGARTSIGLRAETSAAAVRAGLSRFAEHPLLTDSNTVPVVTAADGCLPAELDCVPRAVELAASALESAAGALAAGAPPGRPAPLLLGLPEPRPGFSADDGDRLCAELLRRRPGGVDWDLRPLSLGHAAALEATRLAHEKIESGEWPVCVVGGVDSYLQLDALRWLESRRQLLVEGATSGFVAGEAAGFVVLASSDGWTRARLPSGAVVVAAHSARESKLLGSPDVSLGEGLTAAVDGALHGLSPPEQRVDDVLCDINGERYRSEEWGFVALRLGTVFRDPAAYQMPARCWGDVGAATGALLMMLAAQAWQRGYDRGPRTLVWASSPGGLRSAVLLERGDTPEPTGIVR